MPKNTRIKIEGYDYKGRIVYSSFINSPLALSAVYKVFNPFFRQNNIYEFAIFKQKIRRTARQKRLLEESALKKLSKM